MKITRVDFSHPIQVLGAMRNSIGDTTDKTADLALGTVDGIQGLLVDSPTAAEVHFIPASHITMVRFKKPAPTPAKK
jgi:hypothetical protein